MAAVAGLSIGLVAADKPKITSQDQLPRFEYPLRGKATDVVTDASACAALAARVRPDLEQLLATYDIEDRTTLQGIQSTLMAIDYLGGDTEARSSAWPSSANSRPSRQTSSRPGCSSRA